MIVCLDFSSFGTNNECDCQYLATPARASSRKHGWQVFVSYGEARLETYYENKTP